MADLTPIQKELLARADSILDSVSKTVSAGVDFASAQLPDIAYQYIAMERVYYSFVILFCLIVFFSSFIWVYRFTFENSQQIEGYNADARYMVWLPWIVINGIVVVSFFNALKPTIMVWFAPKIYIITTMVNLIK